MRVERRLHHAARELREVPIDVPALSDLSRPGHPPARWPRLAVLAAPMLFVAGGFLAVGVMQREVPEPFHSDIPTAPADAGRDPTPLDAPTPSVHEELRMIAGIREDQPPAATPPATRRTVDVGGWGPI